MCAIRSFRFVQWDAYASRDIEIYSTIAGFWSKGLIPYRDLYDFKPPLTYVFHRLIYSVGDLEPHSLWRAFVVLSAVSTLGLYAGLRKAGYAYAAPMGALGLLTFLFVDPFRNIGWHYQNTETLVLVFGVLGFACLMVYETGGGRRWVFAAGTCWGLATMGKQPGILYGFPYLIHLFSLRSDQGLRGYLRESLSGIWWLLLGFSCVLSLFAGYFLFHHALDDAVNAVILDGMRYARLEKDGLLGVLKRPTVEFVTEGLSSFRLWPYSAGIVGLVLVSVIRPSRWTLILGSWLVTGFVAAVMGPRKESHYLIMFQPALALTVGFVVQLASGTSPQPLSSDSEKEEPAFFDLLGGVLIACLLFGGLWLEGWYPRRNLDLATRERERLQIEIGNKIRGIAEPGDTLFLRDEPVTVYLFSGIAPSSKFIVEDFPSRKQIRKEWLKILDATPTFVFVSQATKKKIEDDRAGDPVTGKLARMIPENYRILINRPVGVVYCRNDRYPAVRQGGAPAPNDKASDDEPRTERIFLETLMPVESRWGFAPPRMGFDHTGGTIRMGNVLYSHGIGVHSWCRLRYNVPMKARRFQATVGLSDSVRDCSKADVVFEVKSGRGDLLFSSGIVTPGSPALSVDVEVTGLKQILLVVTEGANGRDCDHANWANASFLMERVSNRASK